MDGQDVMEGGGGRMRPRPGVGGSNPPPLTGGWILQSSGARSELRIDWFQATYQQAADTVRGLASQAMGCGLDDWITLDRGWMGWQACEQGPGKAKLYYDHKDPERKDCHLEMSGSPCELMGYERARRLVEESQAMGAKPTRIDLALDDHMRLIDVSGVVEALRSSSVVTRAKQGLHMESFAIGGLEAANAQLESLGYGAGWQRDVTGETVYVGSKDSQQRLRVYDKALEMLFKGDGDGTGPMRWEMQFRDETAQTLLKQLAESGGAWGVAAASRLAHFVDFKEGEDTNVTRRERVAWYDMLLGEVEQVSAYPPKPEKTLEELLEYAVPHWGPTIACFRAKYGPEVLEAMADEGKRKWRSKHFRLAGVPEIGPR